MTKTLFVTLMTEITSSVATFGTWLDAVEKAFGDAAATTILEKTDPYARISMMATLTGWDIDVLIDRSLKWHLSSFNAKSLPVPFEWKEKVEAWIRKMGYHYMIESVAYPEEAMPCEKINITLCVDNIGVAPMYVLIPLHIKLKSTDAEYTFKCDVDLTKWLPGKHKGNICIQLPEDIAKGEYDLEAGLLGDDGMRAYFCTDAEYDNGFYKLGRIEIK